MFIRAACLNATGKGHAMAVVSDDPIEGLIIRPG
jgi:hypothetical protein